MASYSNQRVYTQLDLLRFDICGRRFEIQRSTAARYSGSIFGLLASEANEGRENLLSAKGIFVRSMNDQEAWYAERSPEAFGLILDYMCTGRLHCPYSVCKELLKEELIFWRMYDVSLPDCCWDDEDEDLEVQKMLDEKEQKENRKKTRQDDVSHASRHAKKIKMILRRVVGDPRSSTGAMIFSSLSIFFILLAVVNLIISTMPSLQVCKVPIETTATETFANASNIDEINETSANTRRKKIVGLKYQEHCEGSIVFEIIECICVGWFTFEWVLRFGSARRKGAFLKSPLNIIDLLAIVPFYVDILIWFVGIDAETSRRQQGVEDVLKLLRMFRVFRLFNIVRLVRYSESLKLMGASLWQSRSEFGVLAVFICFTMTLFSSVVFYCEKDLENTEFTSIPATFWWAVVTVTTVGYGDMSPKSTGGKFFAAICCVIGIVIVAFPVSVLVEHFHRLYRSRAKKTPLHRMAIMVTPGEIAIVQMRGPAGPHKISPYEMSCKL